MPSVGITLILYTSTAQQDQLMADLSAAAASREQAITGATHNKGTWAWNRWQQYCKSVGCDDPYLNSFSQIKQNLMLGAFAMTVRESRFTQHCSETLVEGTVQGIISHVEQAFWELGQQNPTKDTENMLSILLSWQFRTHCGNDPKQVPPKSLPFTVLDKLAKRQVIDLDKAIAQLTMSPAFFACYSCEYLHVPRWEMKRTKLLCLQNIRFYKNRCLLLALSDNLEFAENMAMTFEMQKTFRNMIQSSMVGQTILFCDQFCNGHALLIKTGHTWALRRILQSARFGAIINVNR
jgi:hypothetical protein